MSDHVFLNLLNEAFPSNIMVFLDEFSKCNNT